MNSLEVSSFKIEETEGFFTFKNENTTIGFVRFNEKGPILESIISYGNSDNPNSDHYTDQMELYSRFKTKKMTFDKQEIYDKAKSIYNPD